MPRFKTEAQLLSMTAANAPSSPFLAGHRTHGHLSVPFFNTVMDILNAIAMRYHIGIETFAIVADDHMQMAFFNPHLYINVPGAGMFVNIINGFFEDQETIAPLFHIQPVFFKLLIQL